MCRGAIRLLSTNSAPQSAVTACRACGCWAARSTRTRSAVRGVQDDGRARAQVTPSVRVGAYEHVHQAAVELANLRREVTSGVDPLHCHEISTPAVKRRPGSRRRTVDGTGPAVVISVVTGDRERSVGQCGTDAADAVAVIAAVSLRRVLLDDRWPAPRVLSRAVRLRSPAPGRHRARPWL